MKKCCGKGCVQSVYQNRYQNNSTETVLLHRHIDYDEKFEWHFFFVFHFRRRNTQSSFRNVAIIVSLMKHHFSSTSLDSKLAMNSFHSSLHQPIAALHENIENPWLSMSHQNHCRCKLPSWRLCHRPLRLKSNHCYFIYLKWNGVLIISYRKAVR